MILKEKELVNAVNASFRIAITHGPDGATKKWTVDLKSKPPFIGERGDDTPVDVDVTIKDSDIMLLADGKLKPDQVIDL